MEGSTKSYKHFIPQILSANPDVSHSLSRMCACTNGDICQPPRNRSRTNRTATSCGESRQNRVLAPVTGAMGADAQDMVNSAQLAVDDYNAKGGVGGYKLELVAADTVDMRSGA
jgi:hypothetical protein